MEWQYISVAKSLITLAHGDKHKYCGTLPQYFNPQKVGLKLPW
jgi:hypothetical protein